MESITKEQAIKIADSGIWRDMTDEQIVKFQLFQNRLCMPFNVFQSAVERVFGRSVFTHEFAYPENLRKEFLREKEPPTFEEILSLFPKEKHVIFV